MIHAAESTHWYDKAGLPVYQVEAVKGGVRPTTLRDARKLGLGPSVTGVIKCAAAPGLERWKQQQVLLSALTLKRGIAETDDEFTKRIMQDSQEQAKKAAERGTAIHAAIQGWYEDVIPPQEYLPHCEGTAKAVIGWLGERWVSERSFFHPLGFGGKVDLSCDLAVLDFKTKEFGPDDDLKTWDEHHMQLAAYREGLGDPEARCAICYVSVNNPGLARVIEIPEDDLQRGWECFKALFQYWKAKNRYSPC